MTKKEQFYKDLENDPRVKSFSMNSKNILVSLNKDYYVGNFLGKFLNYFGWVSNSMKTINYELSQVTKIPNLDKNRDLFLEFRKVESEFFSSSNKVARLENELKTAQLDLIEKNKKYEKYLKLIKDAGIEVFNERF